MNHLNLSELLTAGWGASWQPDVRDRREWPEIDEWPPPTGAPAASADDRPILERIGESRLVLVGR